MSVSTRTLRRQLAAAIADDSAPAVASSARQLLDSSAADADDVVLEALMVALLHSDQPDAVVQLAADGRFTSAIRSSPRLSLCHAYALYRLRDVDGCLARLRSPPLAALKDDAGVSHLRAQAEYKRGRFAEAANIYQSEFTAQQLSSDVELSANVLSSLILAQDIVTAKQRMQQWKLDTAPSTYELAFNSSCVWIASGDMEAARRSLSAAQRLARASLQTDGLTEAEIADETAVLSVQEAYLQQRCGHPDSALALYTEVLHRHPSDSGVVAVASNNIISLRSGEQRVFDSLKRSSKAVAVTQSQAADEEKLTVRQRQILQFNRCLVLLSGRQLAHCRQQVEQMSRQLPDCELSALVEAALLTAEKRTTEAEQRLQAFVAQHPLHSAECQLAIAHLALLRGDGRTAISRMEELQADALYLQQLPAFSSAINTASLPPSAPQSALPPLRQRPAVVATLAALYEQEADVETASKTVDAAVQYWTAAAAPSSPLSSCPAVKPLLLSLLESAADFHLLHQRFREAAQCLQQYGQLAGSGSGGRSSRSAAAMDGKQLEHIAKTVLATAAVDLEAATAQASLLPPLDFSGLDVSKLEASVAPELLSRKRRPAAAAAADSTAGEDGGSAATAEAARRRKAAAAARRREKRRAHRRIRYPKGFDPSAAHNPPPDPERWLPKWERTQLDRKGRRRRQQDIAPMRGAQGGTSASAGNFVPLPAAAAASASAAASAPSPPSAASSSSTTSNARGDAAAEQPRAASSKPAVAAAAAAAKKKKKKGKMGF